MDGVLFRCLHECVTIYLCVRFRKNNTYRHSLYQSVCANAVFSVIPMFIVHLSRNVNMQCVRLIVPIHRHVDSTYKNWYIIHWKILERFKNDPILFFYEYQLSLIDDILHLSYNDPQHVVCEFIDRIFIVPM